MPLLRDVMEKIAKWMSKAWDIYEKEGWVGLIHEAVSTAIDVLIDVLGNPDIWVVMGTIVWEILTRLSLGNLLSEWIFGKPAAWTDFRNVIDWVSSYLKFLGDFWGGLFDWVKNFFAPIGTLISNIYNNAVIPMLNYLREMLSPIRNAINNAISNVLTPVYNLIRNIWNNTLSSAINIIKTNLNTLHSFFNGLTVTNFISRFITAMTSMFSTLFASLVKSMGDVISDIIPDAKSLGDGVKNTINGIFGTHFAEGGIATQPTYALFGEAGPEAVIPLNQISQVMNELSTNTSNTFGGNSIGGMNYITINIDGAKDPIAVGDQVQRVLEKTVGKASSKLMWW